MISRVSFTKTCDDENVIISSYSCEVNLGATMMRRHVLKSFEIKCSSILTMIVFVAIAWSISVSAHAQLTKYGDADCDKCRPGEYKQVVSDVILHGEYVHRDDPPCGDISAANQGIGEAIADGVVKTTLNPYALVGSLNVVAKNLHIEGSVGTLLSKYANDNGHASCKVICGALPSGAVVTGIRTRVQTVFHTTDPNAMAIIGQNKKGDFAHVFFADVKPNSICQVISNWSHNRDRKIELSYWFTSAVPPIEER